MNAIDAQAAEIAPAVLRSLSWLASLLGNRFVRAVIQAALYMTLGGLPAWLFALIAAILDGWGPVLKPEVVAELRLFQSVLETYRRDAPPAIAAELPPRVWGESPFRDPEAARRIVQMTARTARESLS